MNLTFLLETLGLLFISTLLLRIAGKKSMAKMSNLEVVIILAIGTTMGHATIKEHKFWQIIVILIFFILYLITLQYLQIKSKTIRRYLTGNATVVIRNGQIIGANLKKLRMTNQQLEMKLRQKGISFISNVNTATIESDGELGYELMENAQPITREELLKLIKENQNEYLQNDQNKKQDNLFNKVPGV
ncbi:DUF421 domain-containing protein [Bacillus sp. ISL-18]|uniref:DUF421 domain-containing protein n=1 Tax=Bacillus sp. ISL-18 TaxID=2819118 RepID=UPI001BE8209F|nr:YetF domain-containing protein [Bacillus sp. ISL-18]MBT2655773.1 DUF421 domain-containing protein [Bacillus sp. ISL-18]